ncbi:DUF2303 family protein [Neptunicella sp.]|uniref:DUF2303 family protein n=1 Tax=Neptunicella sp. TaxID=2125986 RepID=UPI003F68EF1F
MLDKDAILELQKAATAQEATRALVESYQSGVQQDSEVPAAVALPDNFKLVDIEQYLPTRTRFRGNYKTLDIQSFAEYCGDNAKESVPTATQIFINEKAMQATAIFNIGDIGTPGHCDHTSQLELPKSAAYKTLLDTVNSRIDQQSFSDWLEDWGGNISVIGLSGETMPLALAVNAVRKISVERAREIESTVGQFENSASVSERVAAKNKDDLPAYITFTCSPYHGLIERQIKVRVSLLTSRDDPAFTLRIIAAEELDEQIANEFKELVITKTKALKCSVYLGKFAA